MTAGHCLRQQLFDAANQDRDRKRLHQIFDLVLVEEKGDVRIGRKPGDKDKTIRQGRALLLRLQVELVATKLGHLQVADYCVVLMRLDLEHGLLAVKGNVHKEIFVSQYPLERG